MAKTDQFQKIVKFQNVAFITTVCITGISLISLAFFMERDNVFLSRLLLTFGSSLLGTGFGILFNTFTNQSALAAMRELVEHTVRGPLSSSDEELEAFRSQMHNYLMTKVDGAWRWRYRRFDFTKVHTPGKLVATVNVPDPADSAIAHVYRSEAYLAGPRMVLVTTAKSSAEPPVVHIYPFATERFAPHFAGTAVLRSWDGTDVIAPVLMSTKRLLLDVDYGEGTLPAEAGDKLYQLWLKASHRNGEGYVHAP